MIMEKIRKVIGFLPMTRREFGKWCKELDAVFEAIEVADAQHGEIEKGIVDQLSKLTKSVVTGATKTEESKDDRGMEVQ